MGDSMEVDDVEFSSSSVNDLNTESSENGEVKRRSVLWRYFISLDPQRAKCKLCSVVFSYKSTISNLKSHLVRKHPSIKAPGVPYKYKKSSTLQRKLNTGPSPDKKWDIFSVKLDESSAPAENAIEIITSTPQQTTKEHIQKNVLKIVTPAKLLKPSTPKDDFLFGCSDFQTMHNKTWYVDKTLFIKSVLKECDRLLITAPKRCGKTTNLNMLKKFVEIETDRNGDPIRLHLEAGTKYLSEQQISSNFKLFMEKKIFKGEGLSKNIFNKNFFTKYFGRHPVIYLSFKNVGGDDFLEFKYSLKSIVCNAFREHKYLIDSRVCDDKYCRDFLSSYMSNDRYVSDETMKESLRVLSQALCSHFNNKNKVYVIIDDLDEPINNILHNKELSSRDSNRILQLFKGILVNLLKDNPNIERVLAVANHHYAEALISDCNIIHKAYLQNDLSQYFGFSNEEVEKLLSDYDLSDSLSEVKIWYDGYGMTTSSGDLLEMYNNWSVLQYLYERELKNHQPIGCLNKFKNVLTRDILKNKIELLISRRSITIKYKNEIAMEDTASLKKMFFSTKYTIDDDDIDLFFRFLYEEGYLNLLCRTEETIELSIPNIEIYSEYCKFFFSFDFFKSYYNVADEDLDSLAKSLNDLKTGVEKKTITQLVESIKNLFRNTRVLPQNDFELQAPLYHFVKKYFAGVKGEALTMPKRYLKCDIGLAMDDKLGIVLEVVTYDRGTSIDALSQVVSNKYNEIFNFDGLNDELYLGLHLREDKKISISYLVNNLDLSFADTIISS